MSAGASERYDVCIIGAGAAGLVLAEQLSREPSMRICLIEAGPAHFRDRKEPFRVRSVLKEHVGVNEGRVTAFGGATNTWGGGLIRLSPPDFEAIEGRPDTRWPVGYAELEPHYAAVEALFGIDASRHCAESVFIDRPGLHVRRRPTILPFRSKNSRRSLARRSPAGRTGRATRRSARSFPPARGGSRPSRSTLRTPAGRASRRGTSSSRRASSTRTCWPSACSRRADPPAHPGAASTFTITCRFPWRCSGRSRRGGSRGGSATASSTG
ncbi:MAG: GMC family oxidoreductase [Phycisphaeraceae bacterium]|nr:GMC family oxidoreductase [Phycisphaeraceae bacterium]